jgi:hypothetical protein
VSTFKLKATMPFETIAKAFAERATENIATLRFFSDGRLIAQPLFHQSVKELGLVDGDLVTVETPQSGGSAAL